MKCQLWLALIKLNCNYCRCYSRATVVPIRSKVESQCIHSWIRIPICEMLFVRHLMRCKCSIFSHQCSIIRAFFHNKWKWLHFYMLIYLLKKTCLHQLHTLMAWNSLWRHLQIWLKICFFQEFVQKTLNIVQSLPEICMTQHLMWLLGNCFPISCLVQDKQQVYPWTFLCSPCSMRNMSSLQPSLPLYPSCK